jgi:hypothetical protein
MVKFQKINVGWDIKFDAVLTEEEISNCNIKSLEHVGDYEIELKNNIMSFSCIFDQNELRENETIDERLELIKKDIENLTKSCIT